MSDLASEDPPESFELEATLAAAEKQLVEIAIRYYDRLWREVEGCLRQIREDISRLPATAGPHVEEFVANLEPRLETRHQGAQGSVGLTPQTKARKSAGTLRSGKEEVEAPPGSRGPPPGPIWGGLKPTGSDVAVP